VETATEAALAFVGAFLVLAPAIYAAMRIQQWREQRTLSPDGSDDKLPSGGNDGD
jgi:hypothetical protein